MPDRHYFGTKALAEMTGYSQKHLQDLARREYEKPEEERRLVVFRESNRYFVRYDSLLEYMKDVGRLSDG